jgi:hypothetical protein
MLHSLILLSLLFAARATKYQLKLFSQDCPNERNLAGSAFFEVQQTQTVVVRLLDRYADEQLVADFTLDIIRGPQVYWHGYNYTTTFTTEECQLAPFRRAAQLIKHDLPIFSRISCKEDADCDDGINCTREHCDTSLGYCVIEPQHDDCPTVCIPKTCFGGRRPRALCANDADCVGGLCSASHCVGGRYDGQPCSASFFDAAGKRLGNWETDICERRGGFCLAGQPTTPCFKNLE